MNGPRALDALLIGLFPLGVLLSFGGFPDLYKSALGGAIESLLLLAAALLAFQVAHALRELPEARRNWLVFATGLLLFGVGEAWDIPYELPGAERPPIAPPDLVYLVAYVTVPVALIGFLRAYRRAFPVGSTRELQLTLLGLVAALAALGVLVVRPLLERPLPLPEKIHMVSFAVLDLGMLAPLALLVRTAFAFRGGLVARAWAVLLTGFALMEVADLLFSLTPWLEGTSLFWLDQVFYIAAYSLTLKGVALHRELAT